MNKSTHGFYKNKIVCVTGAGGSIGSEICRALLKAGVEKLIVVSLTEGGLYALQRSLKHDRDKQSIVYALGSVSDPALMRELLEGVDIVVHAAAHKHVPICEQNPLAAIANNIGGTCTLAAVALDAGVEKFIFISTDKAVKPSSVMGATKKIAEMALRDVFSGGKTQFVTVRFGNVLDSAGSVLPLWREQLAAGKQITITDPKCERYFMSIPDAVELVLAAGEFEQGTYIFDMGKPKLIGDLAAETIRAWGDVHTRTSTQVKIVGLRPGEKLVEELHHGAELAPTAHPKVFQLVDEGGLRKLDLKQLSALSDHARGRNVKASLHYLWEMVK